MVTRTRRLLALTLSLWTASLIAADDVDPENDGSQYFWSPSLGWVNAEPAVEGNPGLTAGDEFSGWLWSANAGWISLNCNNTDSCNDVDYAVTHDGAGNLGGHAWSPNIGWISFSCQNSESCGEVEFGVAVDLDTGELSGYAWAANAGWLSFSCGNTASCGEVDYGVTIDARKLLYLIFGDGFES